MVHAAAARRRDESGFTLLEVMIAMVLFGILVGLAVGPWANYRAKQEHKGATRELVAFLRRAQVRSAAEETTYRVDLTATTATVFRSNGTTFDQQQSIQTPSSTITYSGASFLQESGGTGTSVWFYPRGSASKGSVTVVRAGSETTYTIDVEGLTARVSYE